MFFNSVLQKFYGDTIKLAGSYIKKDGIIFLYDTNNSKIICNNIEKDNNRTIDKSFYNELIKREAGISIIDWYSDNIFYFEKEHLKNIMKEIICVNDVDIMDNFMWYKYDKRNKIFSQFVEIAEGMFIVLENLLFIIQCGIKTFVILPTEFVYGIKNKVVCLIVPIYKM